TGALEAEQHRVERLNRTLSVLSAVNALIVRAPDREGLLQEACRIAVEKGGFAFAAITVREHAKDVVVSRGEGKAEFPEEPKLQVRNEEPEGSRVLLPLVVAGETAGALLLRSAVRGFFDEEEMKLLHELAGDIAFALQHLAQRARMDY